jgi:hypothetical protein
MGVSPGKQSFLTDVAAVAQIELTVSNSGIPSIATDWACSAEYEGKVYSSRFVVLTGLSKMTFGNLSIGAEHMIQEQTTKPITTGDQRIGWLIVTFKGIEMAQLTNPQTKWTILCADVIGNKCELEHHMTGIPAGHAGYVPGGVIPTSGGIGG